MNKCVSAFQRASQYFLKRASVSSCTASVDGNKFLASRFACSAASWANAPAEFKFWGCKLMKGNITLNETKNFVTKVLPYFGVSFSVGWILATGEFVPVGTVDHYM